ncbi:MAG: orotate phosphoribosyltransferase [Zoogloeaceae bacterium]|jgi:orotate phosphoribosyltransferase|nr:orotate phosphoribosyltransferase [Zoogloeaceae bacterium]
MTELQKNPDFRLSFIEFAIERQVLRFGEFKTKAGRRSPYFFNAGLFNDGIAMTRLCGFYAEAALASGLSFDMLFGSAYKGIPLVTGVAMNMAERGINYPFAYNRKEAKDHGEGGVTVGAPIKGRVLIVDDVISAGTSVRESVELIRTAGGEPVGVLIALDRMERGQGELSAVEEVERDFGLPVISVATLDHLMNFLSLCDNEIISSSREAIVIYRARYGSRQNGS